MPSFVEPQSIGENRILIMGVEFDLGGSQWDWIPKDVSDYTPEDILNASMFQSAVAGFGGAPAGYLCPAGHTCVAEAGTNGMFVRSLQNGRLYFSQAGYQRYVRGPEIDWAGVVHDLGIIAGGAIGGAGEALAAIATLLGTAAWGVGFWNSNPSAQ